MLSRLNNCKLWFESSNFVLKNYCAVLFSNQGFENSNLFENLKHRFEDIFIPCAYEVLPMGGVGRVRYTAFKFNDSVIPSSFPLNILRTN